MFSTFSLIKGVKLLMIILFSDVLLRDVNKGFIQNDPKRVIFYINVICNKNHKNSFCFKQV